MNKTIGLILGILVTASTAFAIKGDAEKTSYKIDTKASKVYWTAKKVTGEHTGYLLIGSGNIKVQENKVVSGLVDMDLNSIVCTDLENADYNKKLVGHLKSDDFFSVEKHPSAKFEITSIKQAADGAGYNIVGNLSIKGITNEISFPAKINVSGGMVTALGTASIDRTKWDIKYGSGKFFEGLGDKMINDEFEISFELQANAEGEKVSVY